MSQAQDDLVARATDPNAELTTLHELAQNYPGLRPYIAANPRTYPDLLNWLGTLGDPAVDAALAARTQAQTNGAFTTAVQDATATQALPGGQPATIAFLNVSVSSSAKPTVQCISISLCSPSSAVISTTRPLILSKSSVAKSSYLSIKNAASSINAN